MKRYMMALDAGTTSNRAILFDENATIVADAQKEFPQIFPHPGWVEHNPNAIFSTMVGCIAEVLAHIDPKNAEIICMGITNQRETTVVWDRETGEPIYNAIVWQCRRTSDYCVQLQKEHYEKMIHEKTGLPIDAYFSATKIRWILDHVEGARQKAKDGKLMFGTIDTWLVYKLTGGKVHATDYSNASRTMLLNIHTGEWDPDILRLMDIPVSMLPEVKNTADDYGTTDLKVLNREIKIRSVCGDQQSSLFGQACFQKGECKNTYGTGGFLLMNTGEECVMSENGLITTIAWSLNGKRQYALEGSIFVAGSAVQWLRDELRILDRSEDAAYMATCVEDTADCYVVPAFTGLGAPYWDQYARGTIVGITRGTTKYHIIRATLESIAYLSYDILELMQRESQIELKNLRVDGGACANDFLMQFQADMIQTNILRPTVKELTAFGAMALAGIYEKVYTDMDSLREIWKLDEIFSPKISGEKRNRMIARWRKAVNYAKGWAKES